MPRKFTTDEARTIGGHLKIDWSKIDLEQFRQGLEVEMEHGKHDEETDVTHDDLLKTGKIAWAHLKEVPDYYKRLKKVEYGERENIISDLIVQQSLDQLAKKPGDKKAADKLASEVKRRIAMKRVRIGTDGMLAMDDEDDERVDYMTDVHGREHKPGGTSDGGQFTSTTAARNSPIQSLLALHANADKMTVSEVRDKAEEIIKGLSKVDLSEALKGMGFTPSGSAKAMSTKIVQQIVELAATGAQSRSIDEMFKRQVNYAWDESQHPRGQPENAGEFVSKSGVLNKDKEPDKAKFIGAKVGGAVHAHAESVKNYIAKVVGGIPEELTSDAGQKDKKPYDVKLPGKRKDHDIEVKSMTVGGKTSISVHEDALLRKVDHAKRTGNEFHTVVVDDRETYDNGVNKENFSGHRLYYKRGSGRYSLGQMYKVKDEAELKKLILTPTNKLPESARGSLPPPPPVDELQKKAAAASESRKARDAARKERNKDLLREQARARAAKKREAA